jgi:hypothetical protein
MATKYDYIALRNEYIQTPGLSIRALCERHGIKTWSTVNKRKNDEGWEAKRAEFERQVENKSLEHLATKRAQKIAEIQLDALEVIHAGILKMAEDMDATEEYEVGGNVKSRKVMRIHPRDLAILIDKFQSLIGQPSQVNENRNLNLGVQAEVDATDLRTILAALRPQPVIAGPTGSADRQHPAEARTN